MELKTALVSYIFLISSGNLLVKAHHNFGYNFGNSQPLQLANTQRYTFGSSNGFGGGSINLGGGRFQPSYESSFDTSPFGSSGSINYGSSLNQPLISSFGQQRSLTSFNHGLQGTNNFAPGTLNSGFNSGLFNNKFTVPTRSYNFGSLNSGFDTSALHLGAFTGASNIENSQLKSDCVHNSGIDSGSLNLDSLKTVPNLDSGFQTGANLGSIDSKTSFDFGSLNTKPELSHTTFNSESFNFGSKNTPTLTSTISKTPDFGNTKSVSTGSFNLGSLNSQSHSSLDLTHTQFPTTSFNLDSVKDFKSGFGSSVLNSGSLNLGSLSQKTNVGSANIGVLNTKAEFPSIETGSIDFSTLHQKNYYSGSTGVGHSNNANTEAHNTGISQFNSFNTGSNAGLKGSTNFDFNKHGGFDSGYQNTGFNSGYNTGSNTPFNTDNSGLTNTGVSHFDSSNTGFNTGHQGSTNFDFNNNGGFNTGYQNTGLNSGSNTQLNTDNFGSTNTGVSHFGSSNTGFNTGHQGSTNFDFNNNGGFNSGYQNTGLNSGSNTQFNTDNFGSTNTGVSHLDSSNTGLNTGHQGSTNFDFQNTGGLNSGYQTTDFNTGNQGLSNFNFQNTGGFNTENHNFGNHHQTQPHKETLNTQNFHQGSTNPTDPGYLPPFSNVQHQTNQEQLASNFNPSQPSNLYGTPSKTYAVPKVTGKLTGTVGLPGSASQNKDNYPGIYPQTKLTLPKETPGSFNFGFIEKKEQSKTTESSQHVNDSSKNTLGGGILDLRSGAIGAEWNSTSNNI